MSGELFQHPWPGSQCPSFCARTPAHTALLSSYPGIPSSLQVYTADHSLCLLQAPCPCTEQWVHTMVCVCQRMHDGVGGRKRQGAPPPCANILLAGTPGFSYSTGSRSDYDCGCHHCITACPVITTLLQQLCPGPHLTQQMAARTGHALANSSSYLHLCASHSSIPHHTPNLSESSLHEDALEPLWNNCWGVRIFYCNAYLPLKLLLPLVISITEHRLWFRSVVHSTKKKEKKNEAGEKAW